MRAYHSTGEERYLETAIRALAPFSRAVQADSQTCGVRANFLGQVGLPWYEEYPVLPSVYVLNGFIFSLVGLYDLTQVSYLHACS